MKSKSKYIISVLTVGFVSLVILSVLLFWARKACQGIIYEALSVRKTTAIAIKPSGLLPQIDSNSTTVEQSSIKAYIGDAVVSHSIGLVQSLRSLKNGRVGDFVIGGRDKLILFDKKTGLFVFYDTFKQKRGWAKKSKLYAGPKGVSEKADKKLGSFSQPKSGLWKSDGRSFVFFDNSRSTFFRVDFEKQKVTKGPKIPKDIKPVQLAGYNGLNKNSGALGPMEWSHPKKENIRVGTYSSKDWILILDQSGTIRKLNNQTLELSGQAGYLPSASPWDRQIISARPHDLFAYKVLPFSIDNKHAGTIAGSISREAMALQIAVFDLDGKLVKKKTAYLNLDKPGGPALIIALYILENLQPPLLGLTSYFTASSIEAVAGHRGLFILPNSFAAMMARETRGIIGPFFIALLIISPSIILGSLLAWRVRKDAAIVGLSKNAKLYWTIGTILFGISAYITYRLTRPKITLVTCVNCGKLRRPDMNICHRCGGSWDIAELIPPTWRVLDEHKEAIPQQAT